MSANSTPREMAVAETQAYASVHNLQAALGTAVQQVMQERAPNALARVAHLLLEQAYQAPTPRSQPEQPLPELPTERPLDAWRARLVRDMAVGFELEVRAELAGSTLEAERCESFRELMEAGPLAHEAAWYTSDDNFHAAMRDSLKIKNQIMLAATNLELIVALPAEAQQRAAPYIVRWLDSPTRALRRIATELLGGNTLYGVTVAGEKPPMPSAVLAPHADAIVRRLDDSDAHIRHAAGEMLALLPTSRLETHAAEIVAHLEGEEREVRDNTLKALGKLPPWVIAPHTPAIVARLDDPEWTVRKSALWVLRRLPVEALQPQKELIRAKLQTYEKLYFRLAVHALLCKAAPGEEADHLGAILSHLSDADESHRWAAVDALGKLEPSALAQHVDGLFSALEDPKRDVRSAAVDALSQREVLAPHAGLVALRLAHADLGVRRAAAEILGKLEPEALEAYATDAAPLLADADAPMRNAALGLLSKMGAAALTPHAVAIVYCLDDGNEQMRHTASELLARHPFVLLAPQADLVAERVRHPAGKTRLAALETLAKDPAVLSARLPEFANALNDREAFVRLFACQTLDAFHSDDLRPYMAALKKRLFDYDEEVRKMAQFLLGRL